MNKEFKFEVNVALSEDDEGYIASSPQINGCSACGPTIEYAILEFAFALQGYAGVMVEDGEMFERLNSETEKE